jgi:hypothetical protein
MPVHEYVPELPLAELSSKRSSVFLPIPKRASIGDYSKAELQALLVWVASDGQLRNERRACGRDVCRDTV